ncbi:unnamed protein product [Arabidopsis lyrata]|uniref:Predicted protein n=1 Tax=Arabidopsis lyrata subsp. lyrata TaxID=81972 RepID=D7LB60_ARALL|nr:predicted protein [Arabidopsis lyrata subsp. lyrata]CAH8262115.1 unnamed protein product [Arabidopsis lyrata]
MNTRLLSLIFLRLLRNHHFWLSPSPSSPSDQFSHLTNFSSGQEWFSDHIQLHLPSLVSVVVSPVVNRRQDISI